MEPIKDILTREIHVRSLTPEQIESRQAEFVISDEAPDSYGTVFRMDGWDLTRYEKNPLVLYAHQSWGDNPDNIIGTGEVFREGDQLIGRVTFETEDVNPKAEKVFKKVQAGTLRMASIGAKPTEGHWGVEEASEDPEILYFDRQQLLEFSVVPIGSNPNALKRNAEALVDIKKQFTRNSDVNIEEENEQSEQTTVRAAQCINYKY